MGASKPSGSFTRIVEGAWVCENGHRGASIVTIDGTCAVCGTPMRPESLNENVTRKLVEGEFGPIVLETKTYESIVRPTRSMRLRAWRWRRRVRKMGVEVLVDELSRRTDEAFLHGEERS